MSLGTEAKIYGKKRGASSQPGDVDPTEFHFSMKLGNVNLLNLLKKNEVIQLACDKAVAEALRQGVTWDVDQVIKGKKHGVDYTFSTNSSTNETTGETTTKQAFNIYLEWIGFWIKLHEGLQWSKLMGTTIACFWDDKPGVENHITPKKKTLDQGLYFAPNDDPQAYLDFDCFYPVTSGNGFEIIELDEDQKPLIYKLTIFVEGMEKKKTTYIHKDRVVVLAAPRKEIKWGGSSRVEGLAIYALAGQQMLEALVARAKKLAGGVLTATGVNSIEEANKLNNFLGDDLTYVDRLFLGTDKDLKWVTPDLKASGEFTALFDIMTTTYARHLRFSKQMMDGEPEGARASAKFDMLSSYTEIYGIQSHYKRCVEEMVFKLGKLETSFEWNEIVPEMMENDFTVGFNETGGGEKEPSKEEKKEPESNEERE